MDSGYNREAFAIAQRATVAPNFHEARAILAEIASEKISDPDVASYVEFCKDLAQYCIDHGIQRSADLNPWSVLVTADKGKAARTAFGRWWQRGVAGPIMSVLEGGWLAVRLRGWFKLQEELTARYS
jgi:hypothetical protein